MYNKLVSKRVHFIAEKFIKLQQQTKSKVKAVITCLTDDSEATYPADFVFDCSGKNSSVAKSVNLIQQSRGLQARFKSESLVDTNPITDHLVAQLIIPHNHLLHHFVTITATKNAVPPNLAFIGSSDKQIEAREKLKDLGWNYEAFPTFYYYAQNSSDKICLYMETPTNLPKNKQLAWIMLLITIYSNGRIKDYQELKPSRKYGEKPRIMAFKSTPHIMNTAVAQYEDLPTVFLGFDAFKGFDYRLASGVTSGIMCCELMFKELVIIDGNIRSFDSQAIDKELFAYVNGEYKSLMVKLLNAREEAIVNGFIHFSKLYFIAAAKHASDSLIKERYNMTSAKLAFQGAVGLYAIIKACKIPETVYRIERLNQCFTLLIHAKRLTPSNEAATLSDINSQMRDVITQLTMEVISFVTEKGLKPILFSSDRSRSYFANIKRKLFVDIKKNALELDGLSAVDFIKIESDELLNQINKAEVITLEKTRSSFDYDHLLSELITKKSTIPIFQLKTSSIKEDDSKHDKIDGISRGLSS